MCIRDRVGPFLRVGVAVALDLRLRFDLLKDARNARSDGGGRRQIRVGIRPRQAVFHPQGPRIMADNAETGRAVFIAPCQAGRRKGARRKAAIAVDRGQEHKAQIPDVFLQAPQEMPEGLADTLLGLRSWNKVWPAASFIEMCR